MLLLTDFVEGAGEPRANFGAGACDVEGEPGPGGMYRSEAIEKEEEEEECVAGELSLSPRNYRRSRW